MNAAAPCPGENEIVGLIQGFLSPDSVHSIEEHLDVCATCVTLMEELALVLVPADGAVVGELPRIGRYRIERVVGAGAMGTVYLAHDPELKRDIAVKLIRPELLTLPDGATIRARLLREAQILASLSHPNVVTVHDVGTVDDNLFIAVEYVEGTTLRQWADHEQPDWRQVVAALVAAGRGLEAAHGAGIFHRDVKPENVLMGSDDRVLLTDFGLATMAAVGPAGEGLDNVIADEGAVVQTALTNAGAIVARRCTWHPSNYRARPPTLAATNSRFVFPCTSCCSARDRFKAAPSSSCWPRCTPVPWCRRQLETYLSGYASVF